MDLRNLLGLKKPDIKRMESERDIEGLTRLLKYDYDESVRRDAAFAIGKITGPHTDPESEIEDTDLTVEQSVEKLMISLKSDDLKLQKNGVRELVDIGKPALKPVIKALDDEKWRVRWYAAEILGEIGDKSAVNPLIKTFNDENSGVRSNCTIALVEIGEESVKPLIKALKNDNWQVRWHAAEALGGIGDENAVDSLAKSLDDENPLVKKTAATSLGNIGNVNAVKFLKKALNDDDVEVQDAVLAALDKIG